MTPFMNSTSNRPRSRREHRLLRIVLGLVALPALAAVSRADGPAPPPVAPRPDAPIVVTAKLVEIPGKFPEDDLYDYAYVMRYEVMGGPMDKQSIFVAHYKPRQPRSAIKDKMKSVVSGKLRSFHQGDVHKLQITGNLKSVWKGALVDEFSSVDHKSTRYFALVADPD
jgi:hypothetical protein